MSAMVPKAAFMVEILLAELIFLFPAEKRSMFPLRYALSVAACVVVSIFCPISYSSLLSQFFLFLFLFAVSVGLMGVCFRLSPPTLVSLCVAGYAIEHIAFHVVKIASFYGFLSGVETPLFEHRILCEAALFPVIYLLFLFTLGLYSARRQCWKRVDMRFNYLSIVIIFMCIGLTRAASFFGDQNSVTVSLYAIVACTMALAVQFMLFRAVEMRHEYETVQLLWQEDRKQYALSKATIDTINIKYHDLKHKLRDLTGRLPADEIASLQDAVRVYGSGVRTGNEALDVLLTENSLRCGEEGITLTYTGNGADFGFMNVMDVYSLFGNAVENAMEAVRGVADPEKKIIDVVSERMGDMINIGVTNFFAGEVRFEDGLPVTTKAAERGFHGYGIKSMKLIAEKYGGSLSASADGEIFRLNIYLMQN